MTSAAPAQLPRIAIYDTTLRDGSQGEGVSFSLADKLAVARALDESSVDYIEGGYPHSNEKDQAFFAEAHRTRLCRHARLVAFGSTRRANTPATEDAGLTAVLAAQTPTVCLFGKTWDFHVREALRVSLDENLAMIADSVRRVKAADREMIYDAEHLFDGYRANPAYALATLRAAAEAGADLICLCDTNGGSLPHDVAAIVAEIASALPGVPLGIHTHNDGDLAVANALAAVRAGAVHVQGTVNGIGERCGNCDWLSTAANLRLKMGRACLADHSLASLTALSRFVTQLANLPARDGQPFVGRSAFAHKAGMHASALARNTSTYEHIDPAVVGNDRRILVSELAGAASITTAMSRLGFAPPDKSTLRAILDEVTTREANGYQFEAAEGSFELLIRRHIGGVPRLFELEHYQAVVVRRGATESDHDGTPAGGAAAEPLTECSVKLRVGDCIQHTAADGHGPVNALDGALRKALEGHYPELTDVHLLDYKVRVVNSGAGTAAKVRVTIQMRDGTADYSTVGVSENILEASYLALVDALALKVVRHRHCSPAAAHQ